MTLISAVSVKKLASSRPAVVTGAMGKARPSAYASFSKDPAGGWLSDHTRPGALCRFPAFTRQARIAPPIVSTRGDGWHEGGAHMTAKQLALTGEFATPSEENVSDLEW